MLGMMASATVGACVFRSSSAFSRDVPQAGVTQDIALRPSLSHLRLEEALGGGGSVDIEDEVYGRTSTGPAGCVRR